jgi:hypothetical protein
MNPNSLDLLLAFLLALTVLTAVVFHRDTVEARRRRLHAERVLGIRTAQRDSARTERDAAIAHAEEATELLTLASQDARRRHPAGLALLDGLVKP